MTVQGRYEVPAAKGSRVTWARWTRGAAWPWAYGEGTFVLCYLGIEETWVVEADDGRQISLFPCFGDQMWPA